ncbi:uncharacterized protein LOC144209950 [Stigmatopora nigra]
MVSPQEFYPRRGVFFYATFTSKLVTISSRTSCQANQACWKEVTNSPRLQRSSRHNMSSVNCGMEKQLSCHRGGNAITVYSSPTSLPPLPLHVVCLHHRPPGKQPMTPDSPLPHPTRLRWRVCSPGLKAGPQDWEERRFSPSGNYIQLLKETVPAWPGLKLDNSEERGSKRRGPQPCGPVRFEVAFFDFGQEVCSLERCQPKDGGSEREKRE